MKHRILGTLTIAATAILATACTDQDESSPNTPTSGQAIRFAANTEFARSGDITTNSLRTFNVYAFTGNDKATYMDNVTVTKTGTNAWTYSPLKYWPADQTLDFYAFAPASWVGDNSPLAPVPYDNGEGTEDIIYAVNPGLSGYTDAPNAQVIFNFRHALSKVTVKMSSADARLTVKVTNVAMSNIYSKGDFTFPSASTADTQDISTIGKWTNLSAARPYIYHISQDLNDVITLTTTPTDMGDTGMGLGGGKYMIPQTLTWRSNGAGNDTYIAVMCSVYDASTGVKIWPNANTPEENKVDGSINGDGLLKFPLSSDKFTAWTPGVHYIYNLVINGNEEMGTINFGNPTVDSYVDLTTSFE